MMFQPWSLVLVVALLPGSGHWRVLGQWVDPPPRFDCPANVMALYPCNCTRGTNDGVFVECANTNIASLSVALRLIKTKVHTLTIRDCNMERLYGDLFNRPISIKVLNIQDTPIKDISEGTFAGIITESLEELHLTNTWLTRLPPTIQNLTQHKVLSVVQSRISFLPPAIFDGLGSLVQLTLADAQVSQIEAGTFSALKRLRKLSLFKNNLSAIARGQFQTQDELEYLDLSHNNFTKMDPHYFQDLRKLMWLNMSHNAIDKVEGRTFARNSLLRVLHLEHNQLSRLDANSFRGMRSMRRLFFADNQISLVGRGTFRSVSRIGTVDLARNRLTKVDYQMFADLRFIDTIDLAENQIDEVQKESFQYLYQTSVNISHNLLTEIPSGVFISCENLTLLDLSHNQLRLIHPTAFDENSYTSELLLQFNQLTSMSQVPLTHQKGLMVLNASHNSIMDIPKKTFPVLYELHTVDLCHNNLTTVEKSAFANLLTLRYLYLHHNHLTTLDASTFGKINTLLHLDLSHNLLSDLGRGLFSGLSSLRSLSLEHNQLQDIPSPPISLTHLRLAHNNISQIKGRQPWPVMNSMLYLDLDHNSLNDSLERGHLSGLNTLGTLLLRANGMTKPPKEALQDLQSLQILHLQDNLMTNLSVNALGKLPVVSQLSLSGNKLSNISTLAFEQLLQLVHLDLSFNNLSYIPPGAFKGLVALQSLDLSHNRLESLQNRTHGLFEDCLSIRTLNLSHNSIPFVTAKMFPESRWIPYRLRYLDLSHNRIPVVTRDLLTGTKHLEYLNLSHNAINDIRQDVVNNLTTLHVLDISGNVLTDKLFQKQTPFLGAATNLTSLLMSGNKFSLLPTEEIVKQQKLRLLDVRFNQLQNYSPELTDQIKVGLDVLYEGNPLVCDCQLRPISFWLGSVGRAQMRDQAWDRATCALPSYLQGRSVSSLIEQQLICEHSEDAARFKLSPDVKFREVKQSGDKLELSWFVNTNEDVGNFRLELRSSAIPQSTLLAKTIDYSHRFESVSGLPSGQTLSLCLLAQTSTGRIKSWKQDQCTPVGPFNAATSDPAPSKALLMAVLIFASARMYGPNSGP